MDSHLKVAPEDKHRRKKKVSAFICRWVISRTARANIPMATDMFANRLLPLRAALCDTQTPPVLLSRACPWSNASGANL